MENEFEIKDTTGEMNSLDVYIMLRSRIRDISEYEWIVYGGVVDDMRNFSVVRDPQTSATIYFSGYIDESDNEGDHQNLKIYGEARQIDHALTKIRGILPKRFSLESIAEKAEVKV